MREREREEKREGRMKREATRWHCCVVDLISHPLCVPSFSPPFLGLCFYLMLSPPSIFSPTLSPPLFLCTACMMEPVIQLGIERTRTAGVPELKLGA